MGRAVEFHEHGGAHLDPRTAEPDAEPGAELQHGFDEQRRKGTSSTAPSRSARRLRVTRYVVRRRNSAPERATLDLCADAELAKVGVMAIDGAKVRANAWPPRGTRIGAGRQRVPAFSQR